jgi:hypothetical protein
MKKALGYIRIPKATGFPYQVPCLPSNLIRNLDFSQTLSTKRLAPFNKFSRCHLPLNRKGPASSIRASPKRANSE